MRTTPPASGVILKQRMRRLRVVRAIGEPFVALPHARIGGEHLRDVIAERADKVGNCRDMRGDHAAEGHERHVFLAQPLNRPTAYDALRVREEDHLEQHRRRIRRRAGGVVPKPGVDVHQIDGVLERVVQRVLEGTRQQLEGEVDRDELRVGGQRLVAGHEAVLDSGVAVTQLVAGGRRCHFNCRSATQRVSGFPTASLAGESGLHAVSAPGAPW